MKFLINIVAWALMSCCIGIANSEVYHIIPSSTDPCPVHWHQCYTLHEFSHIQKGKQNNLTLLFWPGVHRLHFDYKLGYSTYFEMSSYSHFLKANIYCDNYSRFNVYRANNVSIYGLNFQGCGGNKFTKVKILKIFTSTFSHNYAAALEVNRTKYALIQNVHLFLILLSIVKILIHSAVLLVE